MAITKIWSVKSRLDTSLNYIGNPEKTGLKPDIEAVEGAIKYIENKDKTENCSYVEAFNCSAANAFADMINTQKLFGKTGRKNGVLAYHLVQSFRDFETTPETAHQCGVELVNRLFADKYEVVLATHIDRDHLHNHIIINAVSFVDGSKYRRSFKDYFVDIRGISDEICREHCLSVIENPQNRGMHYAEWKALSSGKPTIRGQMRIELDGIIAQSKTMIHFFELLRKNGYQVRSGNRKYTAIKAPYSERYIRLKSLGDEYTEESINERIRAARSGIRLTPPSYQTKVFRIKGSLKSYRRKKLTGFMALYFHYLYFFKKIRRRQASKKTSAFMREEIIKFNRYQKQFHFLYDNGIETAEQLAEYKADREDKINVLKEKRRLLYTERKNTDEQEEISNKIAEINAELKTCRAAAGMCGAISEDARRISEKYKILCAISAEEMKKEDKRNEHKRRSR